MKFKKITLVILFMCCVAASHAQWTNKTMLFGGLNRSYRIYVSPNYSASDPASIVMTLHGMGDNMTNFSTLGFNLIADTANIIVLVPQAVSDVYAGTAWNSGAGTMGYYPNASVNDIGYLNALIDTTIANYSVDPQSVYLCGFSMGGFMTQRMAIQSNSRFAAFASMSGTKGAAITNFAPGRTIPIAHFHGTSDSTVFFTNNEYGIDADSLVTLWVNSNGCDPEPDTTHFANTISGDGITVDMYRYTGATTDAEVRFYVMNGAGHTVLYEPANDLTEIYEIWMFFRQHRWLSAGLDRSVAPAVEVQFFPNPATGYITLLSNGAGSIEIFDVTGKLVQRSVLTEASQIIDIRGLQTGVYFLQAVSGDQVSTQKLVVR